MAGQGRTRRIRWLWIALLAAALLATWRVARRLQPKHAADTATDRPLQTHPTTRGAATAILDASPRSRGAGAPFDVSRRWGSGDFALGRTSPKEGNPEAPMSFAVASDGHVVVLDQVNGRLVRIDREGRTIGTVGLHERAPQDVALGPRGETAILDRLGDQAVTLRSASGKVIGSLPLRGKGIDEPGLVTGVFIDGEDVYVERRHGPLVLLGDINGNIAPDRTEIPGRPTRDGALLVSAGIVDADAGRMYVSAIDRKLKEHRFTREIRTGAPLRSIALLDSDKHGTIYVGVVLATSDGEWQHVYCMEPQRGDPFGQIEVPASSMPDETMRDMAVMGDGGVVIAERTEFGIRYLEHRCQ